MHILELSNLLTTSERIALIIHKKPDGDAIGAATGFMEYLSKCRQKDSTLFFEENHPDNLDFILNEENKTHLVYADKDLEKAKDAILKSDLLICLDFNNPDRTGIYSDFIVESKAKKVLIDHHPNPELSCFDLAFSFPEKSSTCELLYEILMQMEDINGDAHKLPLHCAEALMTGMTTDSNNFANSTSPSTLRMAATLIEAGVDRDMLLNNIYNNYRENRFRLMGELLANEMKITENGVAYMILSRNAMNSHQIKEGETEGFVNIPLGISNVRMSILLKEDQGFYRVSIRSKEGVAANEFSNKFFHGGGHVKAAGGRLVFPGDIENKHHAEEYILKAIEEYFK